MNAANSSLLGGGGVDGAIHRAGGPAILDACREIVGRIGRLPAGTGRRNSRRTPAGALRHPYRRPVLERRQQGEAETLASCHRESIRIADELQLASIAFPAISTGALPVSG